MADIALPSLSRHLERSFRLIARAPAQEYRSPFDGSLQTGSTQGPRWVAAFDLRVMAEADVVELQAFLMKLRGKANRALIPILSRSVPRGTITTSGVTVNGALAVGATSVTFAGAGNAKTLDTGDYFKIGDQVLMAVDGPYTSTAGGAMASVAFEPPLRVAALDAAAVTLSSPTIRMILTSEAGWKTERLSLTQVDALEFEESFT